MHAIVADRLCICVVYGSASHSPASFMAIIQADLRESLVSGYSSSSGCRTSPSTWLAGGRPPANACIYLRVVTSGHVTKMAVTPFDPSPMALCFIEPELWPSDVLHCGNSDFRPFCLCDLDLDPIMMNLTRITWRYTGCANMNFVTSRLSKVIV